MRGRTAFRGNFEQIDKYEKTSAGEPYRLLFLGLCWKADHRRAPPWAKFFNRQPTESRSTFQVTFASSRSDFLELFPLMGVPHVLSTPAASLTCSIPRPGSLAPRWHRRCRPCRRVAAGRRCRTCRRVAAGRRCRPCLACSARQPEYIRNVDARPPPLQVARQPDRRTELARSNHDPNSH